jgi:hypothetical protein
MEGIHRLAGVGDRFDLVSGLLEDGADQPSDVSIVVDDKDSAAQGIASRGRRGFLIEHV